MNKSFIVAVLTVTTIIMMSAVGYANTGVHDITCDSCHGKFLGSGTNLAVTPGALSATNSCTTCHSTLGEAPRMPFDTGSMANYFGNVPGQPSTGSRSSHTFLISSTIYKSMPNKGNTAEGQSTTNGFSGNSPHNNTKLVKQILCVRCHYAASDTNTTKDVNKPYLRSTNLNDALCFDCHRPRRDAINASTNNIGSHPVSYQGSLKSYSTIYKLKTVTKTYSTAFRRVPLSPNINNPTSMLGNYFNNNGSIVCSTCHAVHYGDSSSSTFDNKSSANGFNQDNPALGLKGALQPSKGELLRTDPIGTTAAAINICSSCHKETANLNHDGRGQNIQCNHCHSAHVDYAGDNPPAGEVSPNAYLVRRDFSNMSTTKIKLGGNKKVIYNTFTSLRFKRADNNGICQVCHDLPTGVAIHDLPDTRAKDCIACHNHANGFSASDCTACHGQPPMTSAVGGPNGKASASYLLDESLSPHATHADKAYYNYACKNCHYDGTLAGSHNTTPATFQSVFVETAGSVGDLAGRKNVAGDYSPSAKTCAAVYCHSNGNPRGGTMSWKTATTPSWEYGRNKISDCTSCHESGATLTTNAHAKHVTDNAITCNVCHAATVSDVNAITDRTKHANGTKDIKFTTRPANFFGVFSSSWNSTAGTCNTSCHSDGSGGPSVTTPNWTVPATGACGTCHASIPASTLHPQHFTSPAGPQLGTDPAVCSNCHTHSGGGVTHANGVIDLKAGNSCSPCHPNSAPVWMIGAKVSCESCHTGIASIVTNPISTYTAPLKSSNDTIGHGQYSSATLHVTCTSCHSAAAPHIGAGPTEKRLAPFSGNALCNNCHKSSVMGEYSTTRANLLTHGGTVNKFTTYTSAANLANITAVRSDACAGCHDTHGTTNLMSVRTVINGKPVSFTNRSSGFITSVLNGGYYNGLCQVCHTKTKYFRNNRAPELDHMGSLGKDCMDCHTHKGGMFAFQGKGGCGDCHGYPPVRVNVTAIRLPGTIGTQGNYSSAKFQDYSGGAGAHSVAGHIPKNAVATQQMANCNDCHYNTFVNGTHAKGPSSPSQSAVNIVVDPKYKFNNNSTIKYNTQTCSNVSCHFKKTPNWTNGLQ